MKKTKKKLLMREIEIFGKDSNYGFYDYKTFIINQNMSMHS